MNYNNLITPLLTDLYQLTMVYAHFKSGREKEDAVFELFFRKCPFQGGFCIFAGLDEVLNFLQSFHFTQSDIDYLKQTPSFSHLNDDDDGGGFFDYLLNLNCSEVKLYAMREGSLCFPREPLIRVEGPLGITQLLETTLLTLVNFPSLVCTNAARMKLAANPQNNPQIKLAEFGLRRAQGPDGGLSASKYCIMGGFNATSNVLAGKLLGVPITGTHAHSFVQSFTSLDQIKTFSLKEAGSDHNGSKKKLLDLVEKYRRLLEWEHTNTGELAAFIAYAHAFPNTFLCLVDTFHTLDSGVRNFILVALALDELGYTPRGVRLDSGNLADLSKACHALFRETHDKLKRPFLLNLDIAASNDINEELLIKLREDGHKITLFGIGTHLVTCQRQPALGCVYKLVSIDGIPRIKLSEEIEKVLIPGKKDMFRLFGDDGCGGHRPALDILVSSSDASTNTDLWPEYNVPFICYDPFDESKQMTITPSKVEKLFHLVFADNQIIHTTTIHEAKEKVTNEIEIFGKTSVTSLKDPGTYAVMVSSTLYRELHDLWEGQ